MSDNVVTIVVIALVVLALLALLAFVLGRKRGRDRAGLRERFGPEYDRTVAETGSKRQAEKELAEAASKRDRVQIRDLHPAERERYLQAWTGVQAAFVDQPAAATRDADRLVSSVMRDRGYPVDDFGTKAHMVAVDHPQVTEHYRAAHAVAARSDEAGTEELRQAFVHYRALFDELLMGPGSGRHAADSNGQSPAQQ